MTTATAPAWEAKRTDETRRVEQALTAAGLSRVDAYRYNSAAVRVRVIDPRFDGQSLDERYAFVERLIATLPEETQRDIMNLYVFGPAELYDKPRSLRATFANHNFENPTQSEL